METCVMSRCVRHGAKKVYYIVVSNCVGYNHLFAKKCLTYHCLGAFLRLFQYVRIFLDMKRRTKLNSSIVY